jgi:replicative DNA helicase
MENGNTQNLAEKIARLLQTETSENVDFHSLQSSLEKINQRLDSIESQINFQNLKFQISNSKSSHSSQEKFANLEELADETIHGFQMEKACPYEPTGKPCDHCAMCSSRGF